MTKKKDTKPVEQVQETQEENQPFGMDPKQLEHARKNLRTQLRERFDKWMTVSDDDATDDDITAAREAFEAEVQKYTNQEYPLADPDNAVAMLEMLIDWNKKHNHWDKGSWRGVIMLDKVLNKALEDIKGAEDKKGLAVDYQTLMFLFKSLQNPNGYGLESAKEMAELEVYDVELGKVKEGHEDDMTFNKIVKAVLKQTNYLQTVDQMLKLLQERVNLAAAGIKVEFKCTELEEFKELHDTWVVTPEGQHQH